MDVHTALTRSGSVVCYMPIKQARKQTKTEALHFQRKTDKYTTDRESFSSDPTFVYADPTLVYVGAYC